MTTHRCVLCGYPAADHTPLRRVLRAWVAHRLAQPRAWLDHQLWRWLQ